MKYLLKTSVIILLSIGLIQLFDSCKKKPALPVVTTAEASGITQTSVVTGGNVTSDGGAEIIVAGVCWSNTPGASVKDKHTNDGYGPGSFSSTLTGLTPNTMYYIRAYAANSEGVGYGNEISFTTSPVVGATLTTSDVTSITSESAISGGNITSDGGSAVTARGVCWSTSDNPTIADSHTADASGTGTFISYLTGLNPDTEYYVRAYAVNSMGTSYGNTLFFTTQQIMTLSDIDGNMYDYITIGTQIWMTENLKTTHYRNGDPIPTGLSDDDWYNASSGAYAVYNNDNDNITTYGLLYNWYAVTDNRQLCPTGWHVPSAEEWTILETYLTENGHGFGGDGNDIAKSLASTSGWGENSLTGAVGNDLTVNNSSGFTALPAGFRHTKGYFAYNYYIGFWWSSSESFSGSPDALSRYLQDSSTVLEKHDYDKNKGLSVRCLKDQ